MCHGKRINSVKYNDFKAVRDKVKTFALYLRYRTPRLGSTHLKKTKKLIA